MKTIKFWIEFFRYYPEYFTIDWIYRNIKGRLICRKYHKSFRPGMFFYGRYSYRSWTCTKCGCYHASIELYNKFKQSDDLMKLRYGTEE